MIAMLPVLVALLVILPISPWNSLPRQGEPSVTLNQEPSLTGTPIPFISIQSPKPGQALQGRQEIIGSLQIPDFGSAELLFAYADDPTNTWFLIQEYSQPITSTILAEWDTTLITDGTYTLRLVVARADGSQIEERVTGLRVRNYTPIETDTPTPITPTVAPASLKTTTPIPTSTPKPPTATPLPPNPAEVTPGKLGQAIAKGTLGVFGLFALLALYGMLRRRLS